MLCGRKRRPRKEDAAAAASDLTDAEAVRAEDAALCEAIAMSLADLVPADNSMQMDATLAWSRQDWEREQAEQRRRLLDLAATRRRATAAAQPARGAPVIKMEDSSDDEPYRPTPPHFGYAGQRSSRWTPARAASRRRHRRTMAATPATMTTATTRASTAISACRTPCI
jgi:hypothetical protein